MPNTNVSVIIKQLSIIHTKGASFFSVNYSSNVAERSHSIWQLKQLLHDASYITVISLGVLQGVAKMRVSVIEEYW